MKIEINDIHIKEAENIFIRGNEFDKKERIPFIKNLETCDLLAVPGSGKTTALMAKLYCLSKQLPFKDGSGILVLAHTNSTVNEIEKELKRHCPNLFEYPNFIGTIQSFVNKFLANPANFIKYENYLYKVDDEIANKKIVDSVKKLEFTNSLKTYFFFQIYGQNTLVSKKELVENYQVVDIKAKEYIKVLKDQKILTKNGLSYTKVKNKHAISILKIDERLKEILKSIHDKAKKIVDIEKNERAIIYSLDLINKKFLYGNSPFRFDSDSGKELLKIIESQFKDGIVRFKDCYSLASWYLHNFPNVKEQLQNRFKYVFIDEMQDLEKYQIDIIDDIFKKGNSKTIMQRIGDPNQSIYNRVKDDCDWKPRKIKYLNGSNRLSPKNAELVNYFTYRNEEENFKVVGERKLLDDEKEIYPHLVLFTKETKEQLKSKFEEIIKNHNLHNIEEKKKGFKIIGWTGERTNVGDGNLCLNTVFGYNKLSKAKKEDFDSLSKYLQLFNQEKETLESARKTILNALITILRFEDKKIVKKIRGKSVERFYTKSDLIEYIKEYSKNEIYEDFKDKLYSWCFDLVSSKNYTLIFDSIKSFIENQLKDWFDLEINHKTQFFIFEFNDENKIKNKKIVEDDLGIEVATVHAVKGQTHCATMYVETAYKKPIYETLKLKEASSNKSIKKQQSKTIPLYKQKQSCETPTGIEALKMMYVGFSRPTHLLCFAVLEENVKDDLDKFKSADWIINDDLIKKNKL
ncbi:hypothetical protein AR687_16785 [Flavobacteriaceae bacterium CRH]|nr:hypothetical protein AR687_16785 [Flavobacteriaceae bacterium CRH]